MGGIDEAALDRLSLVTQMTKHIRVKAGGRTTTASELGQFSPIFVWLLRVIFDYTDIYTLVLLLVVTCLVLEYGCHKLAIGYKIYFFSSSLL